MDASLPDRFRHATFDVYRAQTPSQQAALRISRDVVTTIRSRPSFAERIRRALGLAATDSFHGLYLVGPVGTGKTHLLAAMYQALTPDVACAFVHSSDLFRHTEPPHDLANALADRFDACCLDEVEIDDPANEVRLVRIFRTLQERNVPLLATSNVEPDQFLSNQFGPDRFRRFLHEQFRAHYRVALVRGPDHRRAHARDRPGRGWVGPEPNASAALQDAYEAHAGPSVWWTFDDLLTAATDTAHERLVEQLSRLEALFVAGVDVAQTDDALRLLRIVDALYLHPDPPALFFSAPAPPDAWFDPEAHAGVARAVAEKFRRTVSRLHAMCEVVEVDGASSPPPSASPEAEGPKRSA